MRRLNDVDRESFLMAASLIWKTPTVEGRNIYGQHFTGMDYFVKFHANEATGDVTCDKWHEGTGFLPHHLALSLAFELSLRTVDPSVTTPYWDFTIGSLTPTQAV